MRHPLWILNSALFLVLIIVLFFIIFSRPSLPEWEPVASDGIRQLPQKRMVTEINISKIYEHDLFDTYEKEPLTPQEGPDYVIPFPPPPQERAVQIPKEPVPQFLEPLKLTLKGIIVVNNDDTKNRAIIADTRTKKEEILKVGDSFEDAQLIKIFNKKVIFLRSNGQQELLYLRVKDAQTDPDYAVMESWKNVVRQITADTYLVNPGQFIQRVNNLSQFIDLLDLTTVYAQGKSIGSRIGRIKDGSLGDELGFKPNDIIITVHDISAADTQDRMKIYKTIIAMKTKDSFVVELLRNNRPMTLTFTLDDFRAQEPKLSAVSPGTPSPVAVTGPTQEQINRLEERHKFAPSLRDIREQERQNMLKKGRKKLSSNFTE